MPDSVFGANNQTNTATAVPNAGSDNHIPTQGSAATWGSITSETFLAGPQPGQEQALVKVGNRTMQIATGQQMAEVKSHATTHVYDGDDKLYYHKNRTTEVTLDDTVTVNGNHKIDVKKDRNIAVTQSITENATLNITIQAGVELVLQGPGGFIKIDASGVTIQGVLVKIN